MHGLQLVFSLVRWTPGLKQCGNICISLASCLDENKQVFKEPVTWVNFEGFQPIEILLQFKAEWASTLENAMFLQAATGGAARFYSDFFHSCAISWGLDIVEDAPWFQLWEQCFISGKILG